MKTSPKKILFTLLTTLAIALGGYASASILSIPNSISTLFPGIENNYSIVNFDIQNGFNGIFLWRGNDTGLSQNITLGSDTITGCTEQLQGLYYNNQRGARLRPLDQDTLTQMQGIDSSYLSVQLTGGLYTNCSGVSGENVYGALGHIRGGHTYWTLAGVDYDFTGKQRLPAFSGSFTKSGSFATGWLFDSQGAIGEFAGSSSSQPLACGLELVADSGFEYNNNCSPQTVNWFSASGSTVDFGNLSCTSGNNSMFDDIGGSPYSGSGAVGFFTYNDDPALSGLVEGREYVASEMVLSSGTTYDISFCLSLADISAYATDSFGVYFTSDSDEIEQDNPFDILNVTPQVSFTQYVTGSRSCFSGSFIATDDYKYMAIGSFADNSTQNTQANSGYNPLLDQYSGDMAYYLLDNVSISESCQTCGNGLVEQTEQCDLGTGNSQSCTPGYGQTCDYCSLSCEEETVTGPFCGDNIVNGTEQCDGTSNCKSNCTLKTTGGGGGGGQLEDYCPDGDFTSSYYDGECGQQPMHLAAPVGKACTYSDEDYLGKGPFTDTINHRGYPYTEVMRVSCLHRGRGTNKGLWTYEPNNSITRAEVLKTVVKVLGVAFDDFTIQDEDRPYNGTIPFADVSNSNWFAHYANYAYTKGLTDGLFTTDKDGKKLLNPDQKMTRYEAIKVMMLAYNKINKPLTSLTGSSVMGDVIDKNNPYYSYIRQAETLGFISGIPQKDGSYNFAGQNNITRAEFAKIVGTPFSDQLFDVEEVVLQSNLYKIIVKAIAKTESDKVEFVANVFRSLATISDKDFIKSFKVQKKLFLDTLRTVVLDPLVE